MTGATSRDRAAGGIARRRRLFAAGPMAAGLAAALGAVLAIPAVIAVSGTAMAAGTASRTVLAWGRNNAGQLGDGTTTDAGTPVRAKLPAGTKVTQVRSGCSDTFALTTKGQVLAWGSNSEGQLGNGTTTDSLTPVRVKIPSGTKVTAIRAGCQHSLALTASGQVLAWGYNGFGQLGNNTTNTTDVPVRVKLPAGTKVTAISSGEDFSLARTSSGHVLAWGDNGNGQLGNGTEANSDVPVRAQLPAGVTADSVTAGEDFSLARTSGGGGLFAAWGDNTLGQLGDGTTISTDTPVSVFVLVRGPSLGKLVSLSAGCGHGLALLSGGGMLAWGANNQGELGNGTTTSSDKPAGVMLPAGDKVTSIGAGCVASYARTASGQLLAWGSAGQLGDGATANSAIPVQVDLPAGWRAAAVGSGPMALDALAIVRKKS